MALIDDPTVVASLLTQMEAQLPIPAQVTPEVRHMLGARKVLIPAHRRVRIEHVMSAGDEGGIVCGLAFPGSSREAVVISLTHLRIAAAHPLANAIRQYQRARVHKLSQSR
jgi:hypothetical protein